MDFRNMTVKQCFDNPKTAAIVKEFAPNLTKYPIKLFNKRTCGDIFDLVVSKGIVPRDMAEKIEAAINAL